MKVQKAEPAGSPPPALPPGPDCIPKAPQVLQGPAENMPMAKGAPPTRQWSRRLSPCLPHHIEGTWCGVGPSPLDQAPEGRDCVSPTSLGSS